jgi:hypothetical protein
MRTRDALWGDMDHARIDEDLIADRYLMGKLLDEDRRLFEEHFVDCARCLERLESIKSLRGALKELPVEAVSAALAQEKPALRGRPEPLRVPPLAALLAAACLLLAVPFSVFFYNEARQARRELAGARRASERLQERQAELEQSLRGERAKRERLSESVTAGRSAPVAASVFVLNLTRGAAASEPENRVLVGESSWVTLVFDRPGSARFSDYRVRLSTTDHRPIGDAVTASPTTGGMLAVSLPASLLAAGDYLLAVEGLGPDRTETLATYRFRAVHG